MALKIETPGLMTTVQDTGRTGYQYLGVTPGGMLDPLLGRLANLLAGNKLDEALLEVTLSGPAFTVTEDTVMAVTGLEADVKVDEQPAKLNRPLFLPQNSIVTIGRIKKGARLFIAFAGGIDVPLQLESRSTHLGAGFGGYEGRTLKAGDRLNIGTPSFQLEALRHFEQPAWFAAPRDYPYHTDEIRVIEGPEADGFASRATAEFYGKSYEVTSDSNRMGYRLKGPALSLQDENGQLISQAVAPGTIQVPEGGQPIILMADRQPTGGYPRIGQVIAADLPKLAQKKPGDSLTFVPCTMAEAEAARDHLEDWFIDVAAGLKLKKR